MHVVSALLPGLLVAPAPGLREDPLPAPLRRRRGVLALKGVRQGHAAPAVGEVAPVCPAGPLELRGQWTIERAREHRAPVLVALAGSHGDLVLFEVDVFDAQAKTLAET